MTTIPYIPTLSTKSLKINMSNSDKSIDIQNSVDILMKEKENNIVYYEQENTEWNSTHDLLLKDWKAKIFAYMWIQTECCYYYMNVYNWLAYTIIATSSFAGATMFSLNSYQSHCESLYGIPSIAIQYVVGSISLLSAILTGIIRHIKPGEYFQYHMNTVKQYNTAMRTIDDVLTTNVIYRPSPYKFIKEINEEIDDIITNQKDPPKSLIKRFEKEYGPLERILYGDDIIQICRLKHNLSSELNQIVQGEKYNKKRHSFQSEV